MQFKSACAVLVFSLFSFIFSGTVAQAAQLRIDSSVSSDQKALLTRDLERLDGLSFRPVNPSLQSLMGTSEISSAALARWLQDRVQYVVGENFNLSDHLFTAEYFYSFPNPGVYPVIERSDLRPSGTSVIIMSNLGVGVYLNGKKTRRLLGVKLQNGTKEVQISSPRSGLIQVGPGLFSGKRIVSPQSPDSMANSLVRLATFFHEARHSDGNGRSTGFLHAVCPAGHDLAGYYACDRNLNGPYKVGALMLKAMVEACTDCSVAERETMKVIYSDSFGRLIGVSGDGTRSTAWDARPEGRRQ